jgi:hypothetical protein
MAEQAPIAPFAPLTVEWIIDEAYKVGRDVESHAADRFARPDNWDAVCEYASSRLEQLVTRLRTRMDWES